MKPSHSKKMNKRAKTFLASMAVLAAIALVLFGIVIKAVFEIIRDLPAPTPPTTTTTTNGGSSTTTSGESTTTTTTTSTTGSQIDITTPLSCSAAVLYDAETDEILYSRKADEKCYPASLTKLVTAMTAIKHVELDHEFTVGSEIAMLQPNSSIAGLKQGYKLTLSMLIDAMLVPSGNDAAYTVAVGVARKVHGDSLSDEEAVKNFAEMMNQTAKDLGASNSHFVTPDGYYQDEHYSTPSDLLKIAKAALDNATIRTSVAKPSARCVMLSGQDVTWKNTNPLIQDDKDLYMEEAIGIKSGYTYEGGYCAAAAAVKDGKTVIAIVINAPTSNDRWTDAAIMLKRGLELE